MRTFIILLLLANIAYFGWNQGWLRDLPAPAPKSAIPARPADSLPPFRQAPASLTLVAELDEAERAALVLAAPVSQEAPGLDAGGSAEPAAPTTTPDAYIDVAENAASDPVQMEEPEQNQAVEPDAAPAGPPWCAELGLFAEPAQARSLVPALAALGVAAELQSRQVPVSSTYWVYMPAFASEAEARRMLAELQEKQIDSYYMREGRFPGGISLGVFSRRASAEAVQASMAAQGYATQIGEVLREEARSALALRAPSAGVIEAAGWADFMAKNPGLQLTENVCESVASEF